tara:strand:- start:20807 stop:22288 length:1482 start_codon:yes stop_codon:yes gene_type:complete
MSKLLFNLRLFMDGMQLRKLLFLFVIYSFFIPPAQAEFNTWTEYKSPHFRLYSDLDKAQVESALLDFEVFRATLIELLHLDNKDFVPVDIYAFKSQNDYEKIQPNRKVDGYFQDTFRGPVMVIGPGKLRQLNLSTLYHEYLHYLVRVNSSFKYPRWFDEGIAELYSSLEYDEDFVVIGKMAERAAGKYANSSLLDLESLLTQTNISSASSNMIRKFYSTSWIFVHFLQFSSVNGFDDYRASLTQFLNLYNKGVTPLIAFEQSFSVSLDELQKQLERYNRKRILYAKRFAKPQVTLNYQSNELNQGQLYANMSHLAYSTGQKKNSDRFLEQALTLNNPKALSVKSFLLVRERKTAKALTLLEKLARTKGLDAEVYLNVGQAYKELARRLPKRKDEMRRLAIYYLEQAKKLGGYSQTQVFLADLYWQTGDTQKVSDEIIAAVALMPSNIRLNYLAGSYMVKLKNKVYARFFLGNVINWSKNPKQIAQAQLWLASL